MSSENTRKKNLAELEEKDQEMEELRTSTQKKLRSMEVQMEEEYQERQSVLREKRELERKLSEMGDMQPAANKGKG